MPTITENLERMLADGDEGAPLRFGLGQAYLDKDDYLKATEHLQRAVELDPHYSAAWKLLGQALTGSGHDREAIAAYLEGIEVAEAKGDIQAAREMRVFLKRLQKRSAGAAGDPERHPKI